MHGNVRTSLTDYWESKLHSQLFQHYTTEDRSYDKGGKVQNGRMGAVLSSMFANCYYLSSLKTSIAYTKTRQTTSDMNGDYYCMHAPSKVL